MNIKYFSLVFLVFSSTCSFGRAEKADNFKTHTIRLYSGAGYSSIRHEIIDKDRYSGLIIPAGLEWEKQSLRSSRKVYMSFNKGNIKSDIDDANIMNISLELDYSFSVYKPEAINAISGFYIGPSLFIFTNMRKQVRIDLYDQSHTLGMLALGPNFGVKGNISGSMNYSGMLRMNILSFGGHDNFSTAFLSPMKGFHSSFIFGIDWQVKERAGLGIRYRFDYSNINEWVDFVAGSDILTLSINFKL